MEKKYSRKSIINGTIRCAVTGLCSLGTGILTLLNEQWICAAVLFLFTVWQIIVFPTWIKLWKKNVSSQ